jgi:hypothetical protein
MRVLNFEVTHYSHTFAFVHKKKEENHPTGESPTGGWAAEGSDPIPHQFNPLKI